MRIILALLIIIFPLVTMAQRGTSKKISINKSIGTIVLDGELNEKDWNNAEMANNFFQKFPSDTSFAKTKTTVFCTYDNKNIYFAAICYNTNSSNYVVTSLKRDWSFPINDAFNVVIDPFNDKTNGFSFGVNPLGAEREGLVEFGGQQGVTTAWDNKWFSKVKDYGDKWIVEMAIPFKTLRYNSSIKTWGINFSRNDLINNETSNWNAVPFVFNPVTLTYCGSLIWDNNPPTSGQNIAIIPYLATGFARNYKDKTSNNVKNVNGFGLDAKIAISSSLNLDLTFNPDFSQVEVDRQVTNLSRFSLFFPERRNFFIENSDLFDRFGFRQIRPFFSRKIGLSDDATEITPILYGARLSGKINKDWRIGIMNLQTAGTFKSNPTNYTAAAVQRQVLQKSNISFMLVNKQVLDKKKKIDFNTINFNRVACLDFNYQSINNKWQGKVFYHQAINSNKKFKDAFAHAVFLIKNEKKYSIAWNHEYVGENYNAEVGFTPRLFVENAATNIVLKQSYWRFEPEFRTRFFVKSKIINNHGPGMYLSLYTNKQFSSNEMLWQTFYQVNFQNQAYAKVAVNQLYTKLYFPLDVTRSKNTLLSAKDYNNKTAKVEYFSSPFSKLTYHASIEYGGFYVYNIFTINTEIAYRIQPYINLAIAYNRNELFAPEGFEYRNLEIISPRIDIAITKKLYLTNFLQINTQTNNINLNTRLQWRFAPMSDLFIVYGDNYDAQKFGIKDRQLQIKLTYWLGI